jgi:hypothetical protein
MISIEIFNLSSDNIQTPADSFPNSTWINSSDSFELPLQPPEEAGEQVDIAGRFGYQDFFPVVIIENAGWLLQQDTIIVRIR